MRSLVRLLVWTLLIAGGIVGLLRATALRWWRIPEDDPWLVASVSPTLAPGDWVLLWRLTPPGDGDLVICPEPKAPERIVVGRILGSGNDVINVNGTTITLNGKTLRRESSCDSFAVAHPKSAQLLRQSCSVEDLDGSLYTRGNLVEGFKPPAAMQPQTVTPGQFFLVSDNRQFSLDSRDFGPVDADTCKETFVFRLWGRNGYFDPNRRFELIP